MLLPILSPAAPTPYQTTGPPGPDMSVACNEGALPTTVPMMIVPQMNGTLYGKLPIRLYFQVPVDYVGSDDMRAVVITGAKPVGRFDLTVVARAQYGGQTSIVATPPLMLTQGSYNVTGFFQLGVSQKVRPCPVRDFPLGTFTYGGIVPPKE